MCHLTPARSTLHLAALDRLIALGYVECKTENLFLLIYAGPVRVAAICHVAP